MFVKRTINCHHVLLGFLVCGYRMGLISTQVSGLGKNRSNFLQFSSLLQSYWILRSSLVQRRLLPTAFWRKINIRLQQPDEPYKSNLARVLIGSLKQHLVQRWNWLLFNFRPSQTYPSQGLPTASRRADLGRGLLGVGLISEFVRSFRVGDWFLRACRRFFSRWVR